MSRHDLLPHIRDEWASAMAPLHADARFPSDSRMAALSAHSDRLAAQTQAIHGGELQNDCSQWDQLRAVIRFAAIFLIALTCAAFGVLGALYIGGHAA